MQVDRILIAATVVQPYKVIAAAMWQWRTQLTLEYRNACFRPVQPRQDAAKRGW